MELAVLYTLSAIFVLVALKDRLTIFIFGKIWDKKVIYDLNKEVIYKERVFEKGGLRNFYEPYISFTIDYNYKDIFGELYFRWDKFSFKDKAAMQDFLAKIDAVTIYINPKNPSQFIIHRPEPRIQYWIIAAMFIIFAQGFAHFSV